VIDDTGPVRPITLDADGIELSGLLAEPLAKPRAVVIALHGAGMRAGYFHPRSQPRQSLLELGARLGFSVLSLDRPGYGASSDRLRSGQPVLQQARTVQAAWATFARCHRTGAGPFLLAHSFGGEVAVALAAQAGDGELLGLDLSGVGHEFAVDRAVVASAFESRASWGIHWGPLSLYRPGILREAAGLIATVPAGERQDACEWPDRIAALAARVRAPVRLTFAEHERWWRHDAASVLALRQLFSGTRVQVESLAGAGHNISLSSAARTYHLRAFAFFEQCLTESADALGTARG
jgi:pimeloyl-ACP methyl ester carboxylesterase